MVVLSQGTYLLGERLTLRYQEQRIRNVGKNFWGRERFNIYVNLEIVIAKIPSSKLRRKV